MAQREGKRPSVPRIPRIPGNLDFSAHFQLAYCTVTDPEVASAIGTAPTQSTVPAPRVHFSAGAH